MAFSMRKILREQKKKSKLMARERKFEIDIEHLQKEIELEEKELVIICPINIKLIIYLKYLKTFKFNIFLFNQNVYKNYTKSAFCK